MNEQITPNQLRRLFPGASKSVLARNPLFINVARLAVAEETASHPAVPQSPAAVKFVIWGAPIGKPRMTQRDKWKKRPCVLRYRAWADHARNSIPHLPAAGSFLGWIAYFPIPKSWPAKKKMAMQDTLHQQRPDRDNVDKAILDALFKSDAHIAAGHLEKRWDDGCGPRVELLISEFIQPQKPS